MRTLLLLLCLTSLYGCAPPLRDAPDGWPELKMVEVLDVSPEVTLEICGDGYLQGPTSCAYVDLCARTCTKYYQLNEHTPENIKHEEGHCQGRDHWFSNFFGNLLKQWRVGEACRSAITPEDEAASKVAWILFLLL